MVWPAIIAAGAALYNAYKGEESQQDANLANYNAQKEFAQQGIGWKVQDAKAAGLHPLYALGGSGATFSPSFRAFEGDGIAQAGQNLASAASQAWGPQRELQLAQLEAVKAGTAKDYALASAADAEAAIARNRMLASNPVAQSYPVTRYGNDDLQIDLPGQPYIPGNPSKLSEWKPDTTPAYLTKGEATPGFQRFNVPGIGEMILPSASSMSEALESLENPVLQAAVTAANLYHYGSAAGKAKVAAFARWRGWKDPFGTLNNFSMGR